MAQVPYNPAPSVTPQTAVPFDYQDIKATPDMFGAAIGRGLSSLGEGINDFNQYYNQVTANQAMNTFVDQTYKILDGDNKTDPLTGKTTFVPGIMGMQGQDALDGVPGARQKLQDAYEAARSSLPSGAAQLEFERIARRQYDISQGRLAGHYAQEFPRYVQNVNKATVDNSLYGIRQDPFNDDQFDQHLKTIKDSQANIARQQNNTPENITAAVNDAQEMAISERAKAMAATGPDGAIKAKAYLEQERDGKYISPFTYEQTMTHLRGPLADAIADRARPGNPAGSQASPRSNPQFDQIGATYGISGSYLSRVMHIESGGRPDAQNGPAKGAFQFMPATWARYGQGSPFDLNDSAAAAARLAAANKADLTRSLGRAPTDAELYLAHQQGSGGAAALINNPGMTAKDALALTLHGDTADAARRIRSNGGNPDAPAAQFVSKWAQKFDGAGASPVGGGRGGVPTFAGAAAGGPQGIPGFTFNGPAAGAAPTPPPAPGAPSTPGGLPDKDIWRQNAESMVGDDPMLKREVAARVANDYNQLAAKNATSIKLVTEDLKNAVAAAGDGVDVDFPAKAFSVLPHDVASHWQQEFNVAKSIGQTMRTIQWASPDEIVQMQRDVDSGHGIYSDMLHLDKKGGTSGPGTTGANPDFETSNEESFYRLRTQLKRRVDAEIEHRRQALIGPQADPAAYVMSNPDVKQAAAAIDPKDPATFSNYLKTSLALQEHVGVPEAFQHALTRGQASAQTQAVMNSPDVRKTLDDMGKTYGPYWRNVVNDMVTLGHLPESYQSVMYLKDPLDASLLARAINESKPGKDGQPGTDWTKVLKTPGGVSITANTESAIRTSPDTQNLVDSLSRSGASIDQINGVVGSIELLSYAKRFYEKDQNADEDAIKAFMKGYDFSMPGKPRVPDEFATQTRQNAETALDGLNAKNITVPEGWKALQMTPAEYASMVRASPFWVTNQSSTGLVLRDRHNYPVLDANGNQVFVPFASVPAAPPAPTQPAPAPAETFLPGP